MDSKLEENNKSRLAARKMEDCYKGFFRELDFLEDIRNLEVICIHCRIGIRQCKCKEWSEFTCETDARE